MSTAHLRACASHRRMLHFLPLLGAFLLASAAMLPMRAQDDPNRPPWAQKGKTPPSTSSTTSATGATGTTSTTGTTNSSSDSASGPSSGTAAASTAGRPSSSRSSNNSASSNSSKNNSSKNNSGNKASSSSANNAGVPPGPLSSRRWILRLPPRCQGNRRTRRISAAGFG
jgi:hypothetical protein